MPRFQVTAVLETAQAEKQLAALVGKIREAGKALNESGGIGNSSAGGFGRQRKDIDATAQGLERLKALFAAIKTDAAKIGVENTNPGAFKDLQSRLIALRTALVTLEKDSREMWEPSEVIRYGALVQQVTRELDRLSAAQRGAAARGGAKPLLFGAQDTSDAKSYIAAVKELDSYLTQMEANRRIGQGTLASYKKELREIQQASLIRANDASLGATERGLYAARANKAGSMINAADTREAEKLALAVTRLKVALVDEQITADRAGIAFNRLAERARALGEAQDVSASAARKYIRVQQEAARAAAAAAGGDQGLAAARAAQNRIQSAISQRNAGLLDPNAAVAARKLREELERIVTTSRQEAQNTRLSTAAREAHVKAAEQATAALRKLRAEQAHGPGGGSLPFALNSVGFGVGAISAPALGYVNDALQLNEQMKQAHLTLEATAKFFKLDIVKAREVTKETSDAIRQDEADISQAMANLLRKGFNPEMAAQVVKRFSDSANSAGLKASKAIVAASQAILSDQSRQLNSAGIAENLGPELTRANAAIRKGEEFFKRSYLVTDQAKEQYETLRKMGKSFDEAAQAVARYQFVMVVTAPIAGRTEAALGTLTGAIDNANVKWNEFKRDSVEQISVAAIPVINLWSEALGRFNQSPDFVKNLVGITIAFGGLTLAGVAAIAMLGGLYLRTNSVIAELPMLATGLNNARSALLLFARGLAGGILGAAAPVLLYAKSIRDDTARIYAEIEKNTEDFWAKMAGSRGVEYTSVMQKWSNLSQEVRPRVQESIKNARSPEEKAAYETYLKQIDAEIAKQLDLARAIAKKNKEQNGSVASTELQTENYKMFMRTLEGVAERFEGLKLTSFQKSIRDAQREVARAEEEIRKKEKEYAKDNETGFTPDQAKMARARKDRILPDAMTGLLERELDAQRKAAAQARIQMDRDQAELMKDGIAKRQSLLAAETRSIEEEYGERLRQVRANLEDKNFQTDPKLGKAENARRAAALTQFSRQEVELTAEKNARIKVEEQKATADIVQIRQDRADRMLDLLKGQAQAEVNAVTTSLTTLNLARDRALAGQDEAGRLRVEQNFQRQALGLAKERIEREAGIREGELQTQLARELRDAATLGDGKGRAEALARQRYDQESRTNRQNAVNELAQAELDAQERVSAARVALVERTVDRELAGIGEIEGAQLAALQRRYAREWQFAQARGDAGGVAAYQSALDKVAQEAESRARDAQKLADDARNSVENLTERLEELNGVAAKGLRGAQIAAEKPFTAYIREREKEIEALNRAKANLVNGSPALRADIDRQIAVLNTYVQQATAGRTRASVEAGRAFQQAQFDKIMQERARVAEALYDGGEGDSRAYRAAIAEEATYWRARMRGMEKGSDEYEAARARLEELRQKDAETRNRDALRPLELARQNLTLNEGQQRLAQTEAERNRLMDDRIRLLRQVIELESRRARDPNLKRSDREQAAQNVLAARSQLQESVTARGTAAASDLRATLATLDAQRQLAVGDAARAAIDTQRLRTAQAIAAQDAANAARQNLTLEERRAAEAQVLTSQKAVLDIQRAIQDEQNATVRSVRDLAAAQLDYAATVAVTDEQVTNALRGRAALLRTQLADQDALIEQAIRRGDTEASVNALRAERVRLQGQEITTARELAKRPLELAERQLGTYKEIQTAKAQIAGLDGDSVASARLALDFAERELDVARQKYALAQTQAEREAAGAGVLTAYAGVTKAQTGVARAGLEAERTRLDLLTAQENARFSMLSTEQRRAQEGERAAQQAARELAFVERQLALAGQLRLSDRERNDLQVKRLDLIAQEADRIRAMNDEERSRAQAALERETPRVNKARTDYFGESAVAAQDVMAGLSKNQASIKRLEEVNALLSDQSIVADNDRVIAQLKSYVAEQQATLLEARRTAAILNHDLVLSEVELNSQIRNGTEGTRSLTTASLALHRSREALIAAEREYEAANRGENKERLKAATEGLIKAIGDERNAVQGVQGEYRKLLDTMSSVQNAGAKLRSALSGGERKENLSASREIDRLMSIERRRDAAAGILRTALASGDSARIAEAANELAAQQERYRNQVALLKKAGVSVSASGEGVVRALADEVDRLGVTYDAQAVSILRQQEQVRREEELQARQTADWKARHDGEAGLLSRRAALADREMEAARLWVQTSEGLNGTLSALVEGARAAGTAVIRGVPRRIIEPNPDPPPPPAPQREASREPPKKTDVQLALEKAEQNQAQFKALADSLASIPSVLDVKAEQMKKVGQSQPSPVQPTASNATRITNVTVQNTFHTTLNGTTGTSPQEVRMAIEQAISNRIDQASQRKAWEGGC